jgi:glycosyltransferase involved in cell wall biosynthesis
LRTTTMPGTTVRAVYPQAGIPHSRDKRYVTWGCADLNCRTIFTYVRIAMIAYTVYECDARVRRAVGALTENGYHVDLFTISTGEISESSNSESSNNGLLRIHRLRMSMQQAAAARYAFEYGAFFAWVLARISFLHARRRYDVVYVHNMPNFLVFAGTLPKITGAKIVLDVHDPVAELMASIRGRGLPAWLRRLANAEERLSMSFSDAVITVNESMRRRLRATSQRQVAVVMNLPDPALFTPRQASGDGRDPDLLVYSGTISERNGLDLVVRALSTLVGEFPLLHLRVIGDGPSLEPVRRLAQDLAIADRVEFLGFVPNDQVPSLVSGAAAGIAAQREDIFGSLVFSMKVAEYVALGLPVVCSGVTTMRHYFADDELLFFEPGSPDDLARGIRDLLTHPAAAQDRVFRSRIKLDKLDWPAQKETLVGTVEAAAGSRRPRSRRGTEPLRIPGRRRSAVGGSPSVMTRR